MGRLFVLGDIHGRYKALIQVFERANFDLENDTCIFVGDIVDRGPEPFKCIEFMLKIKKAIFIRGNHDSNFNYWIKTQRDGFQGKNGVLITKLEWIKASDQMKEMTSEYFEKTVPFYIDDQNRMFTHGGFDNNTLVRDHTYHEDNFAWDRTLWQEAFECKENEVIKTADNFTEIYIGHTPTINYSTEEKESIMGIIITIIKNPVITPMYRGGIWNIDTGAGFGIGKLTLMNIETKEIFQSDLINTLYAE